MADGETGPPPRLDLLTPRERECLHLVLENRSSKQIARQLGISQTSVDTHVRRARNKLGIRSRYQAARMLADWERDAKAPRPSEAAIAEKNYGPRPYPIVPPWPLPPLVELNIAQRLFLIIAGAIIAAALFGLVLSAMAAL
jgi:DNA-binding CsgD family transcriptional regulator